MKPDDVTYENENQVFNNLYNGKSYSQLLNPKSKQKFAVGDTVRIPYELKNFDKGYYPTYKDHVYTVKEPIKGDVKYMFRLKDYAGNILNQVFYPEQLQKITENLHRVEKVLKTRKRRGVKEVFVKWLNYPPTYNSWIPHKDLTDLRVTL